MLGFLTYDLIWLHFRKGMLVGHFKSFSYWKIGVCGAGRYGFKGR